MALTYAELRDAINALPPEVQQARAQAFIWDPRLGGIVFSIAAIQPHAQAVELDPVLSSMPLMDPNQHFMVTVVRNAARDEK